MSAATTSINTPKRDGDFLRNLPIAASTKLYVGTLAAIDASGNLVSASDTASLRVLGVVQPNPDGTSGDYDNSAGAAGDLLAVVERGIFKVTNSGTQPVTKAYVGAAVYVEDNQTVAISTSHSIPAGIVVEIDDDGDVWIDTRLHLMVVGTPSDGTITAAKLASNAVTTVKITDANVTGAKLSAAANLRSIVIPLGTIATTGSTKVTIPAPLAGTLSAVKFCGKDALATSDTNYLTFALTNKGQAGAGTTAMLSATASGTTQATGGSAIAAYTTRDCPLHATAGNAAIAAGDCLELSVTATGTLANTVTEATIRLDYTFTA